MLYNIQICTNVESQHKKVNIVERIVIFVPPVGEWKKRARKRVRKTSERETEDEHGAEEEEKT
jgi:hypothetical protein